jgi:hypothetical protein
MRLEQSQTDDGARVVSIPIADDIDPLAIVLVRKQGTTLSAQLENFSAFCEAYIKSAI